MVLDFFKGDIKTVQKIKQYSEADILCITSVSYLELLSVIRGQGRWDVLKVIDKLEMLNFDRKAAVRAAKIYEQAEDAHIEMGMREIVNASICISNNALLLTSERRQYEGVNGLKFV
ncbi:type II toxin-antitoxin system VapC family toxin [Candidatus Micrarchaeota archaeon]|nr:type II toxin-antitoxin system VapC family toxin [Candidatus Micrarchaeota archaeon]